MQLRRAKLTGLVVAAALVAVACGSGSSASGSLTPVKFVLQWVPQAQFAGYFAAVDQGYFKDAGLAVTIVPGGPDVNPMQVVATGAADIGTTWVPKMLAAREGGTDLTDIAQIYQRSGTLEISFKSKGLTSITDLKGKKVGSWLGGDEPELYADLTKNSIDPTNASDVSIVKQDFTMNQLVTGQLDAAEAMIYNEYAQVLEATNPVTGKLYQPSDLNVINFNTDGTAMLQDMIFASQKWLSTGNNAKIAEKFLEASFRGWMYCRDNAASCVQSVLKAGSQLGTSHQTWQLNEVNALIWPSSAGIGQLDTTAWAQTVQIATKYGIIKSAPTGGAYRSDLAQQALAAVSGDTKGTSWQKATVTLAPGGN
jgi:NitT/TauT family transport system substrate-binding protein